jgi:hypothetical protein
VISGTPPSPCQNRPQRLDLFDQKVDEGRDARRALHVGSTADLWPARGSLLADVPAVLSGDVVSKVPAVVHGIASVVFAVLGVLTHLNVGDLF